MSENSENDMLGDYLRARRELIQPDCYGRPRRDSRARDIAAT